MPNIVIGHCYTTENKGDAAIVLATIDQLKRASSECNLTGVSTFSGNDAAYLNHHKALEDAGLRIVPALLPEDKLKVMDRVFEGTVAKAISFSVRALTLGTTIMARRIGLRWRSPLHQPIDVIEQADLFVSKGGSFLYSLGGIRGDISLFKLLVPFWVAARSGVRTVVLAQSLGPFNTRLSEWMIRRALRYIDRIYLRERVCMRYLHFLTPKELEKIADCPDLAFALESAGHSPLNIDYSGNPVGITIVNHQFKDEEARRRYIDTIIASVDYLAAWWPNAKFYVFPQVLSRHVDGSVDVEFAELIAQECLARTGNALEIVAGDHDPRVLQQSYARMRCFLATRLHSAIFAASVGVPTLVFGYHGSKAEGIWQSLGHPDLYFDIEQIHWPDVERSLEMLVGSGDVIRRDFHERCAVIRKQIIEVVDAEVSLVSR